MGKLHAWQRLPHQLLDLRRGTNFDQLGRLLD